MFWWFQYSLGLKVILKSIFTLKNISEKDEVFDKI